MTPELKHLEAAVEELERSAAHATVCVDRALGEYDYAEACERHNQAFAFSRAASIVRRHLEAARKESQSHAENR